MTSVVEAEVRAATTCAGVAEVLRARYTATAPAVCGLAIEVPDMVAVAVVDVMPAEVIDDPGANMSTQVP